MHEQRSRSQKNIESGTRVVNYEEIVQEIGFGRVQWIVLLSSGLTLLMAMNEIIGNGIISISSQCDLKLTSTDKGLLTGVSLIGNVCSSYFWGYLSDTIGRRPVLIASSLATNAFTFILLFVPNAQVFIFLRFCVGLSISGATNVTYAYLGEFFTTHYRPIVINYASLFVAVSVLFVPAIGWSVLLMDWSIPISKDLSIRPWRLLPLLYVFPGFLSVLLLLYLPESPKILYALGRNEEAYASLDWICRKNLGGKTLNDLFGNKICNTHMMNDIEKKLDSKRNNSCLSLLSKLWQDTCPLFQRPLARDFVICCLIMSSVFMSSIGMSVWFPTIQNRLGFYASAENKMKTCDVMEKYINTTVQGFIYDECSEKILNQTYLDFLIYGSLCIVGYALLGVIISKFGRKAILIGFLIVSGICGIELLWISEPIGIVISFSLFMVLTELCMSITNGIVVDLVPTHLCGQAVCICLMIGRLSSVFATNFMEIIMTSHCVLTLLFLTGYSIFCGILGFVLPI